MKVYKVVISRKARAVLREIVLDLSRRASPSTAKYVRDQLIKTAKSLKTVPEGYSKELYLEDLDGDIRSIPKWSFKIVFEVVGKEVRVLTFFQTHQNPSKLGDEIASEIP